MNDERKQGERAGEYPPEDPKSELSKIDEKVVNNSLRIARYVAQTMNGSLEIVEDLKQTALLKYFQLDGISRIQIKNPNAFLYKVMKNEVLNWHRKKSPIALTPIEASEAEQLEWRLADTSHIDDELLLREIWSEVEGEDRRLFELLTFGYTGKEIAVRLGISADAARQRVSRLKAKIKAILEENRVSS